MQFFTMARIYRRPDVAISLRDVWTIADGELNEAAGVACTAHLLHIWVRSILFLDLMVRRYTRSS